METRHPTPPRQDSGFTLMEILVVVAIIGLAYQMVMVNASAFLPKSVMEAESAMLVSQLDYLRTECKLQGRVYTLELDIDENRYRIRFPPEDRYTPDEVEEDERDLVTNWTELDEDVTVAGAGSPQSGSVRGGIYKIIFDENGFTADHEVYLQLMTDEDFVWTIQWNGLTGTAEVIGSVDGVENQRAPVNQGAF